MKRFLQRFGEHAIGVLTGFDRLVFRGSLRFLTYPAGVGMWLSRTGILLTQFGGAIQEMTQEIRKGIEKRTLAAGRPLIYLPSPKESKEERAQAIAAADGITSGLIATFKTVEVAPSFEVGGNRGTKRLEIRSKRRPSLHYYQYLMHPILGFLSIRLQTWLPFSIQVCMNGREFLSRQMDACNLHYRRSDNKFLWIEDFRRAQALMDAQVEAPFGSYLDELARSIYPGCESLLKSPDAKYYWTTYQSEWATDIAFASRADVEQILPILVRHSMSTLQSKDVLRFLGQGLTPRGEIHPALKSEVLTDYKDRRDGARVKHSANQNSQKLYDYHNVLRAENTCNNPRPFKVFRKSEADPESKPKWRPMRKSIADLPRRAQISNGANNRHLDALACAADATPLSELTRDLCRPATWNSRRVRPLHLWNPADHALLATLARGDFLIGGFRNRDLRAILFPGSPDGPLRYKQAAAVTRRLRILRVHGLIARRNATHRYDLTIKGRTLVTALTAAYNASTQALTAAAA